MYIRLPFHFRLSMGLWRDHFDIIENHMIEAGGDLDATMLVLRDKYKDDPQVRVASQYRIQYNRDQVIAYRSVV